MKRVLVCDRMKDFNEDSRSEIEAKLLNFIGQDDYEFDYFSFSGKEIIDFLYYLEENQTDMVFIHLSALRLIKFEDAYEVLIKKFSKIVYILKTYSFQNYKYCSKTIAKINSLLRDCDFIDSGTIIYKSSEYKKKLIKMR